LRDSDRMDQAVVRRRLTVLSDRVLGPGMVKDVLIEQASVK